LRYRDGEREARQRETSGPEGNQFGICNLHDVDRDALRKQVIPAMALAFRFEDDCCRCLYRDIVQVPSIRRLVELGLRAKAK
jgi:hypothetical protein